MYLGQRRDSDFLQNNPPAPVTSPAPTAGPGHGDQQTLRLWRRFEMDGQGLRGGEDVEICTVMQSLECKL